MSHHYSGPNFGFPRGDARLDMTDLYAFTKPGDPDKSILIFNAHPSLVLGSAGTDYHRAFQTRGAIRAQDRHGRRCRCRSRLPCAVLVFQGWDSRPRQCAALWARRMRRLMGQVYRRRGAGVERTGCPVTQLGDFRFFAGWRSDPFFFDVNGDLNDMQFTGDDFFTDKNVCSIVLELPNSELS